MRNYWVSCERFTVWIETDERQVITQSAPMVRSFVGQPRARLLRWAMRFGGVACYEILVGANSDKKRAGE